MQQRLERAVYLIQRVYRGYKGRVLARRVRLHLSTTSRHVLQGLWDTLLGSAEDIAALIFKELSALTADVHKLYPFAKDERMRCLVMKTKMKMRNFDSERDREKPRYSYW